MIYLDTCYILKCYLTEHGSPEVRELVSEADGVASAAHARVEFIAAVHRHLREGRLQSEEMDGVLQGIELLHMEVCNIHEIAFGIGLCKLLRKLCEAT